jgi:cell division protein FtsN
MPAKKTRDGYYVGIRPYKTKSDAEKTAKRLENLGFQTKIRGKKGNYRVDNKT